MEIRVAHAVLGNGLPLIPVPPAFSHIEVSWDVPAIRAFYEELARHFTIGSPDCSAKR
jgi:hypothetical protein